MSRNLEILEQVQQDRELFRVEPVAARPPVRSEPFPVNHRAFSPGEFEREKLLGLAQRLFLAAEGDGHGRRRQVVFCGIDDAEGASVLCAQLGRVLASQVSSKVCVVDANVRAQALYRLLEVERRDGRRSSQATTQAKGLQQIAGNLWLISTHTATNGGVTASLDDVRSQVEELPPQFAYVVINAPPVGTYMDAVLLGQMVDGVVLVLEASSTRRVAALKAKRALEAADVRLLGTVLNNRTFPIPEKIYRLL